mgnify:CR=1 FL=1
MGGTKVDAAYIIELVGERTKVVDGVRVIDEESFRIILEQIQEFSDLGQKKAADVLGAFLKDLQTGKVPAGENADAAFAGWKAAQYEKELSDFSAEWGLQANVLDSAVKAYDGSAPVTLHYLTVFAAFAPRAGRRPSSAEHWVLLLAAIDARQVAASPSPLARRIAGRRFFPPFRPLFAAVPRFPRVWGQESLLP